MRIRIKFKSLFFIAFIGGIIGSGAWMIEHQKVPSFFSEYLFLFLSLHILVPCILAIPVSFIPFGKFTKDNIATFNTLSLYKTIDWKDVSSIKRVNLLFTKYLLVYTPKSKWALWVPLSITKNKELLETMLMSENSVVRSNAKS